MVSNHDRYHDPVDECTRGGPGTYGFKTVKQLLSDQRIITNRLTVLLDRTAECDFIPEKVYISDFGVPFCSRLPIRDRSLDVPGTLPYMAPEILREGWGSGRRADIWAVGCIAYEICLGRKLAETNEALQAYIKTGQGDPSSIDRVLATVPERFGRPVREVIKACLHWDPERRPKADDVRRYLVDEYQKRVSIPARP